MVLTDSRRDRSGSARSSATRAWGTWLLSDRSASSRSIACWIEGMGTPSLIWIRSTQACRSGSVVGSQLGLRSSTTVCPGV